MEIISDYLGCGIVYSGGKNMVVFGVLKFEDITNIIIPMFKLHPIFGVKAKDLADFIQVSELMKKGEHLNAVGLSHIFRIKGSMNKGRKIELLEEDPDPLANNSHALPANFFWAPGPQHKNSEYWLYMYNRDRSILYHSTKDVKEFSVNLKIHRDTLSKHLKEGTYYLGKYSFSRELSSSVLVFKGLSILELNLMLNKDRAKFKRKIRSSD